MRKVFKLVGFASVTLVLFFVAGSLAFYHLVRIGEVRRFLIDEIEKNTALKVDLGEAELEIGWITGIGFRQLTVAEPGATHPAITAERITARVALRPLLERKVIFYEIRLQKPAAQFAADKDGRIPLLDKLLNLPFLKEQGSEIQLDLRSVKVQNGEIEFTDARPAQGVGTWRLFNANVNLERVRGQRLRDFMQDKLRRGAPESAAVLEFSLRGAVEKDRSRMNVKADGRLLFPKDALEFHEARWIADIELVEVPAALLKEQVALGVPIKSMTGHFAQRLHIDGYPARHMSLKGDIEFKQLSIDAPELLLAPLAGADGRAVFELDWSRQRLQLARVDFRSGELKFSLQGEVRSLDSEDPDYRLDFSALSAPVSALRKYLPVKLAQSPRLERAIDMVEAGHVEIKKAGVRAKLSELRRLTDSGLGKQVWFDGEIRDGAGKLPVDDTLPLRGVQGRIRLENGVLRFDDLRGSYGDSRLTDVDGSYELVPPAGGKLELRAVGDFNLAELREQLKAGPLPGAAKLAADVQETAGRGRADLTIKSAPGAPLQFDGKILLDNARLRYDEYSLSEINGVLRFSPKEIRGDKLRVQFRGSPVQIQLALTDYASEDGAFDLTFESTGVRAGVITSLLLDTGTLQDAGIVRGWARYRGT
ncbi:MAG TPA: AsmA family protein, partial [Candidatus Limnocylindria bacterium]|nr:AsmA family protein [Candidatus Limnocylindria bacterium]